MNGFIKIDRRMLDWEWYDDPNTKVVFLHLLLMANWKDGGYKGYKLKAGDVVFGRKALADTLGLSERNVRTALEHLQKTGEIVVKSTNAFSVATLVNWAKYQSEYEEPTNERPTSDQQPTTPKESKKERKYNIPPERDEVATYIAENNLAVDINRFFDYYDSNGWKVGRNKMKDWKATLRNWNSKSRETKPKREVYDV